MTTPAKADVCAVACAEAWRGDGEVLASPMGTIPVLGARLAALTFEPDLLLSDGEAFLLAEAPPLGALGEDTVVEGWLPYRQVFTVVASGRRHVMMGASQIDRYGNTNISCIGAQAHPKAQLLGMRGAPGNTVNHKTSYWIPRHLLRMFVEKVDVVSGVGYDRAAKTPGAARFHGLGVVVTDLAVLDFDGPDHRMQLRSVHPGVTAQDVNEATGFALEVPADVPTTRLPTSEEMAVLNRLDPAGLRYREVKG
jgi:acyl CoA:acetate/3-ketoacid CoA transferase beta subunit